MLNKLSDAESIKISIIPSTYLFHSINFKLTNSGLCTPAADSVVGLVKYGQQLLINVRLMVINSVGFDS